MLPPITHSDSWMQQQSADFHGSKVMEIGAVFCSGCHGKDFSGGDSRVSCMQCHDAYPHVPKWDTDANLHVDYIREKGRQLQSCKNCHSSDYSGGISGKSCLGCHSGTGGPEACNTCHGNIKNNAPPKDLHGNMEMTAPGVGAHQNHFRSYKRYTICHTLPASFADSTHIDSTPFAEVSVYLKWNRDSATCVSPCHHDNGEPYVWNQSDELF